MRGGNEHWCVCVCVCAVVYRLVALAEVQDVF